VVHRDVHPTNIVVTRDTLKLIDFGIALPLREIPSNFTLTPFTQGRVLGGFLDPVCVKEPWAAPTLASDLYGLGALLFYCVTGRIPAAGHDGHDAGILMGKKPPPALRTLSYDAPEELASTVDALLNPDPNRRPRSAEVVLEAIEHARIHDTL